MPKATKFRSKQTMQSINLAPLIKIKQKFPNYNQEISALFLFHRSFARNLLQLSSMRFIYLIKDELLTFISSNCRFQNCPQIIHLKGTSLQNAPLSRVA
ncbi:hypothetical protein [Furfurilactobacillus entadae]|uniref:hypothetical protein n=1 Tax=Furfurilactobacillus entadae TaxID=2922307 RepID=UPI0038B3406E